MKRYEPQFGPADGTIQQSLRNYTAALQLHSTSIMSKDPAKEAEGKIIKQEFIKEMLDNLSEKDVKIICLRFGIGLDGSEEPPLTLEEIGKELGLSKCRVREIEERATMKMKRIAAKMGLIELGRQPNLIPTPNRYNGWTGNR